MKLATYDVCSNRDDIERVCVLIFLVSLNINLFMQMFFKIKGEGGEGIILRHPTAKYVQGYSRFLYKHKV